MSALMVETQAVKEAVRAACRAPSQHNIQPWRWVVDGGALELFLDRSRVLSTDRAGRQAVIGCGAALDHLCVVMSSAGLQANVERLPNPNDPDHLASIEFTRMEHVTDGHRRRGDAIWIRRSDRLPMNPPLNWKLFEPVLRDRLGHYSVHLTVLGEQARPRLTQASQLAESLRLYDSTYHAELQRWTVPFEESAGIPYSALVSGAEGDRVGVKREFPAVHHNERRMRIPEDQATIAVLSTDGDSRADALAAGEALSAVLLECTMAGFATCPLTHLTEIDVTRQMIQTLMGDDTVPQVLIRIGQAPATEKPPARTPRRALADVLKIQGG